MHEAALLAPVPEEHLEGALEICGGEGKVAFGSRAWEVFRKLDELIDDGKTRVFIYASHSKVPTTPPKVTWRGTYIGHLESRGGAHPDGMKFRPPSTLKYPTDNQGFWAVFWEVTGLVRLDKENWLPINELSGLEKDKPYISGFIPEGPLIIQHPIYD